MRYATALLHSTAVSVLTLIHLGILAPEGLGQTALPSSDAPVTVVLASGRHFTAALDTRTDQGHLWLRFAKGSTCVLRPIDWDRVITVEVEGNVYSGGEFHEAVAVVREALPAVDPLATPAGHKVAAWQSNVPSHMPAVLEPAVAPRFGAIALEEPPLPRVRMVEIEARAVNWDSDVEVDGLLLDIYPLDASGYVIPIRGTIDVELIGEDTRVAALGDPLTRLGRWTEQVCPADFFAQGAQFRLPFQAVHPEFDLRWAPKGLVHVRLSVPGQGVFEASESMVRIRPYSALRDRRQQATGRRFLESERTAARDY